MPIPLDPDHDIDLNGGMFSQTSPTQLRAAFDKFYSTGSNHLCVFFHGGLVSRQEGVQTALDLTQPFSNAGAYPFFFIWNSDLWTQIRELLQPHENDRGFVEVANRAVITVAQKIAAVLGDSGLAQRARVRLVVKPLDLRALERFSRNFDRAWASQSGAQLPVSPRELATFGQWLLARKPQTELRARYITTRVRGPRNPLARIFQRLNSGHGHGLYTTVIEELLIALGVADHLAGEIWGQMKKDIDAAFKPDAAAGGTVFLENLAAAWAKKSSLKLTLIGHSAGTIYLQRFLEAFDARFADNAERQVEVILLAAAISFERMHRSVSVLERRTSGIRTFGLSDKRESGYWEVPFVYNKSLLYIVSSLCEGDPEADKPLVGMRRYWSGVRPYNQLYIEDITKFVTLDRTVWAPSPASAAPGFRSDARRHGGLPTEKLTEASVCDALKRGL
jgi:hypothetical protein